jgi:Kdo2-lipid IVA lauroyltransferase/acyltransferase
LARANPQQRGALRNGLEAAAARALLATLRLGSKQFAIRLAQRYTGLLDTFVPKLRAVALRNLELAYPSWTAAERSAAAGGCFHSLARILVTLARMPALNRANIHEWIAYEGLEHFHAAKARGKGVIFATGHLGNWELSAFAHGLLTEPMHVVVRPLDNPSLDAMATRLRTLTGNHVIEKKDGRSVLRALAANQAVGILADQNTSLAEGLFIDFFGLPACTNPGTARLAAHTGAAIIPGYALWDATAARYVLKFYPYLLATGNPLDDTQRIHAQLEQVIRQYPDQWLWIHRRWKTRPPGAVSLY